jgi:hypothetical protein
MQKWQTNQIYKAIQSVDLNPNEFELRDNGEEILLKHKWSKSCFFLGGNAMKYVGIP